MDFVPSLRKIDMICVDIEIEKSILGNNAIKEMEPKERHGLVP
jgi:hypothetical protein